MAEEKILNEEQLSDEELEKVAGGTWTQTGTDRKFFTKLDINMNKVSNMAREIGKKPVLAFGNSSGDSSMINFSMRGNKYKTAAFFVICDDLDREFGNIDKAKKCEKLAEDNGWIKISMRDDFKTIYGDNVIKN